MSFDSYDLLNLSEICLNNLIKRSKCSINHSQPFIVGIMYLIDAGALEYNLVVHRIEFFTDPKVMVEVLLTLKGLGMGGRG